MPEGDTGLDMNKKAATPKGYGDGVDANLAGYDHFNPDRLKNNRHPGVGKCWLPE
jgi:hypothetical protein